jgi:ABC-2 type transport system permease protein
MKLRFNDLEAAFWASWKVFVGDLAPRLWLLSNTFWSIGLVAMIAVHSPSLLTDRVMVQSVAWSAALFMGTSSMLWLVGHALVDARETGLMHVHMSSGGSLFGFVAGKAMVVGLYNIVSLTVVVVFTSLLFGAVPSIMNPPLWILGFLLLQVVSAGISGVFATLLIWLKRPWVATNFMQFLLPVSSGMIPYTIAPQPLKLVMLYSPVSYPFELLRRGATGLELLPVDWGELILVSVVATAVLVLLGALALRWGEKKIMARGI